MMAATELAPPDPFDALAEPLRAMRTHFEALVEPHRPALWEYCRRLTGSGWDAEDLVQEALMRAFAGLPRLWQPVNPRGYLFRIASNAWIDQVRRDRRGPAETLDETVAGPDEADRGLAVDEAMLRMVRLLPPRQRVILLLCATLDFRAGEVAAMLGTTEGAVKAALHRARATLAAAADAPAEAPTHLVPEAQLRPLVRRYVDAFNARDPDGIAALLHEDAVTLIVGSADELGREVTRASSLAEWAAEPEPQRLRPGVLEGRPALFVFHQDAEREALAWIIALEGEEEVHRQRLYYFSPELLRHAAEALGVPVRTHGYQYVAP